MTEAITWEVGLWKMHGVEVSTRATAVQIRNDPGRDYMAK